MKGIYLTLEDKEEIEAEIDVLEKILESAIILPIEENWENLSLKTVESTYGKAY
jgi:hypothetical protein